MKSTKTSCPECGHDAIPIGMLPNRGTELFWICSVCDHRWHYFSPVDEEYTRAEYFITNRNYPLVSAEQL
jgi:transcription elongation factor Elf1